MFRRAMKRAVQNTMRAGAKGIKVEVSGRLGGLRSLVLSGIVKVVYLCIHFVLTSTIQLYVQKQLTVRSVLSLDLPW